MLHLLKRHPLPIRAFFEHVLVLAYALPERTLAPLLPPGLQLDTWHGCGFVAIAMVQTRALRPVGLPAALGQDFFLVGYRVFARLPTPSGQALRGLRILRSDTDRRLMALFGNLLTHYRYRLARVAVRESGGALVIRVRTPGAEADLHLGADLATTPGPLPAGSVFDTVRDARRFAGPMPYTFDYEPQTHSIVVIKGVRSNWHPEPVRVEVLENTFFRQRPFAGVEPILSSAFHLRGIPYRWERGVRQPLAREATDRGG